MHWERYSDAPGLGSPAGGEVDEPLGNTLEHLLPSGSSGGLEHAQERALRGRTPRRRNLTPRDATERYDATKLTNTPNATVTRPNTRTIAGEECRGRGAPWWGRPAPELDRREGRRPRTTRTLLHPALRYAPTSSPCVPRTRST